MIDISNMSECINAPTEEFTLRHLVTFTISRSRIRMKFYFVYRLVHSFMDDMFMNVLIVKYSVATCHYI